MSIFSLYTWPRRRVHVAVGIRFHPVPNFFCAAFDRVPVNSAPLLENGVDEGDEVFVFTHRIVAGAWRRAVVNKVKPARLRRDEVGLWIAATEVRDDCDEEPPMPQEKVRLSRHINEITQLRDRKGFVNTNSRSFPIHYAFAQEKRFRTASPMLLPRQCSPCSSQPSMT
jgi:hypothetical protein